MTAITREYLDALRLQVLDRPGYVAPREVLDLTDALRGVLDVCDRYEHADERFAPPTGQQVAAKVHNALAGTQTGDGAEVISAPAANRDEPAPSSPDCGWCLGPCLGDCWKAQAAPSSPDRTETLAQALAYVDDQPQSVHLYRPMAEYGLRRLDAYDEAHPPPPRYPPDWRDEIEADLRERIAADIEADVLLSPLSGGREVNAYNHGARNAASHAARIVRSGVPRTEEARTGPHSRACGIKRHDHGTECHFNCPTCRGSEVPR